MDLTYYYEGSRLLSVQYCVRKIKELEEDLYNSGYEVFSPDDEEVNAINEKISFYKSMITRLRTSLGKLNYDKLSKIIVEEIAKKLRDFHGDSLLVLFSYMDAYTFEIMVGNIFVTDFFSKRKLYEKNMLLDRHYDDSPYVNKVYLSSFGREIISKLEKLLISKAPNINFEFRHVYNS